jgi:hypothetical protein
MKTFTLDAVIREYLFEVGETTDSKYARFLQYGISTLRDMHLDVSGQKKTVIIDIDPNLSVANLPSDFIRHIRLGVIDGDGVFHPLAEDKNLIGPYITDDCGDLRPATGDVVGNAGFVSVDWNADNFRNGEFTGRMFGLGGGRNRYGYYKFDLSKGWIVFNTDTALKEVCLEYLGDMQSEAFDYIVNPFIIDAVKSGMYLRSIQRDRNITIGEKQNAERTYTKEKAKAVARYDNSTLDEWYYALRKPFRLAPKF